MEESKWAVIYSIPRVFRRVCFTCWKNSAGIDPSSFLMRDRWTTVIFSVLIIDAFLRPVCLKAGFNSSILIQESRRSSGTLEKIPRMMISSPFIERTRAGLTFEDWRSVKGKLTKTMFPGSSYIIDFFFREKNHLKAIPLIGGDCSSNDLLNLT